MDSEHRRKKHRKLPPDEHRRRGPVPIVGEQLALALAVTVRARLVVLAKGRPIGPVARWAYALGRSAIMARLSAGDRWDRADHRGRGKLTAIAMPRTYIHGWPPELECSHGAATRLALDVGVALLEHEFARWGWVELPDERAVDIIAAEHHPEHWCTPRPWARAPAPEPERLRSGSTWLG
jgi:hypothetical protein